MRFVSLENANDEVTFAEALARGIPADGSLYYPLEIPKLTEQQLVALPGLPTTAIDTAILQAWVGDEIPAEDLQTIIASAATFETPVVSVADKHVLELFHGPTMAFKDVAARYLAAFMSYFNEKAGLTSTVLVATSGDTGGAIAHGFGGVKGLRVVVLYPKGRVSQLQQEQLRRVADNVYSVEVMGDFDDCQSLVKQAFSDRELTAAVQLTSANSISIGRLIPQTVYYARAYAQLDRNDLRFVVPSGNLGNLTAGLLAKQMGVPIASFLAANNANDALYRYGQTGLYEPRQTIPTVSNAMDVGAPNNLSRVTKLFNESVKQFRAEVATAHVDDAQTAETIKSVYKTTGYLLDPHTAVAWNASNQHPTENQHDVIVSTASPLKFSEEIERLTGIVVDNATELARLRVIPERYTEMPNDIGELKIYLEQL